jgi:hypothetical protein
VKLGGFGAVTETFDAMVDVGTVTDDLVAELEVLSVVEVEAGAGVDSAEGGMTLKLTLAPQSAREDPFGQQPLSVQYSLARQNAIWSQSLDSTDQSRRERMTDFRLSSNSLRQWDCSSSET